MSDQDDVHAQKTVLEKCQNMYGSYFWENLIARYCKRVCQRAATAKHCSVVCMVLNDEKWTQTDIKLCALETNRYLFISFVIKKRPFDICSLVTP